MLAKHTALVSQPFTACMSAVDPDSSSQLGSALLLSTSRTCSHANELGIVHRRATVIARVQDLWKLFIFTRRCQPKSQFCVGADSDFAVFRHAVVFQLFLVTQFLVISG